MASACLPFLFRAVEIDGVPYWDGGYIGNPAIFPFFRATQTEDVLIVQINPLERANDADSARRDHEPHQRNHLQLLAARRIPRDRFRHPPDRPGHAAARHRRRRIPPHQCASHRARLDVHAAHRRIGKLNSDYDFFEMLQRRRPARRAALPRRAFRRYRRAQHGRSAAPRRRPSGRDTLSPPHGPRCDATRCSPPRSAPPRLEILVADITTLASTPSSTPRTVAARRRRRRRRDPSRGRAGVAGGVPRRSAAARPARQRSPAAIGCRRGT